MAITHLPSTGLLATAASRLSLPPWEDSRRTGGNVTNGELVTNGVGAGATSAQPFTGAYAIGADHRGVMTFNIGGGSAKLTFAMMADGNAQFIEFDASGGA